MRENLVKKAEDGNKFIQQVLDIVGVVVMVLLGFCLLLILFGLVWITSYILG